MKGRWTLIFLGVLLVLAGYAYFGEYRGKARKDKGEENARKVLPAEESDFRKITVSGYGRMIILSKENDAWRILSPIATDADANAVNALISALQNAEIERKLDPVEDPHDFGLTPPRYTIVIETQNAKSDTLFIGDKNPTERSVFMRKAGIPEVLLTSPALLGNLEKGVFEYRDKSVLPFDKDHVREVIIQHATQAPIRILKDGDEWKIVSPMEVPADRYTVDGILNGISNSKMKSVVSEQRVHPDRYGLDHPSAVLTLFLGEEKAQKQLTLGKRTQEGFFACDPTRPMVFTIDSAAAQFSSHTLFDLRDKRIALFEREKVYRIEMNRKNEHLICMKDTSDAWWIVEPRRVKAKYWKISSLLSTIEAMKATRFIGQESSRNPLSRFHSPQMECALQDSGRNELLHVVFGRALDDDNIAVLNQRTSWVYATDNDVLNDLWPKMEEIAEEEKTASDPVTE